MKKAGWGILTVVVLAGMAAVFGYYYFVGRPNVIVEDDGVVFIQPEDSFETVVGILQDKGYLRHEYTFRKVAELKKYPARIKAGRYKIGNGMNNNQLVNLLRSGRQEPIHFTFNNIRTLADFAGTLSRQLAVDSAEFMRLAQDAEYVKKWNFTPETFLGMFIPNTYQIYWHPRTEDFMNRMNAEYVKFWNADRQEKARRAGLSPTAVTIIASIVEEETNQTEEYPVIAGVYVNRLKKGWKLEACPTLKYALGDFTLKRILTKHKEAESPYNTYKYAGLPPGPIRMPSIRCIDAVLDYAHHNYMFFCAKSDFSGTHHFSRTLKEHNRYASEFHQALNRNKIY